MSFRAPKPPDMPWISPYLYVKDVAKAIEFYIRAFGFTKKMELPGPDGLLVHAELSWNDGVIMVGAEGAFGDNIKAPRTTGMLPAVGLYIYCDDVDDLFHRATLAGARTMIKPQDMFWGDRICRVVDPEGHLWTFATKVGEMDAQSAIPID